MGMIIPRDPDVQAQIDEMERQIGELDGEAEDLEEEAKGLRGQADVLQKQQEALEKAHPLRLALEAADVTPDSDMLAAWLASAGRFSS